MRYCKSTIFQANHNLIACELISPSVVCDTAKVRFFKQITTELNTIANNPALFAILQKYDFSSKSQLICSSKTPKIRCLRYCKSTIFQANHNYKRTNNDGRIVVCDTAKVRFFKQITTLKSRNLSASWLFAILQKYDFSSKSQHAYQEKQGCVCCLRYCKSTIFQANHNLFFTILIFNFVVCDTAKVRFFKQITTITKISDMSVGCLRYCKSTIFQANHNIVQYLILIIRLFAILQKYDFSSKSQR